MYGVYHKTTIIRKPVHHNQSVCLDPHTHVVEYVCKHMTTNHEAHLCV